jgi:hypothetical protein
MHPQSGRASTPCSACLNDAPPGERFLRLPARNRIFSLRDRRGECLRKNNCTVSETDTDGSGYGRGLSSYSSKGLHYDKRRNVSYNPKRFAVRNFASIISANTDPEKGTLLNSFF